MNRKEATQWLWKICFEDTDEFIALYFTRRYYDEINYMIYEQDRPIAALQAIPYSLQYGAMQLPVAYISGACTHPDFRQQGYMGRLLQTTHRALYQKNMILSVLIPATSHLWQYYQKAGYAPAFYETSQWLTSSDFRPNKNDAITFKSVAVLSESICGFIAEVAARRCDSILHTAADLAIVLADLHLSGGEAVGCYRHDQLVAIAFCILNPTESVVKDLFAIDSESEQLLLQELLRQSATESICWQRPVSKTVSSLVSHKGMARVISVEKALVAYAARFPHCCHYIHIPLDSDIPENEGYYIVRNGCLVRGYSNQYTYTDFSIEAITALLFSETFAFMSLMLE